MNKLIKINKMLVNCVHIGHKKELLNQSMKKYIININRKISIINLEKTLESLKNIKKILKNIKKENKKILIVCTKKNTKKIIKNIGKKINMPYINKRWLGGSLTNFKTLKSAINRMSYIKIILKKKEFKIKKKRARIYKKKIKRVESFLKGVKNLKKLPEFIFIIGIKENKNALKEAKKKKVISIVIGDTNNDIKNADYVIPGNDDSFKSIIFYIKELKKIIENE